MKLKVLATSFLSLTIVAGAFTPLQLTGDSESLLTTDHDHESFKKKIRIPDQRYRLPNHVVPLHYDLKIRPRLTNRPTDGPQWTIPGEVIILVTCVQQTRNITLHSTVREINESSVMVKNMDTDLIIPVEGHIYQDEIESYAINVKSALQIGQRYSVHIGFLANVHTDRLDGIFRSDYEDPLSGEIKSYATSQFQAFGARSAFPCFDEPSLKATFNITIGHESNYSVISNTPIIATTPIPGRDGWFWETFKKTVPMPTYLVALVISDYSYAEASRDLYHKPTRAYGPKYFIDQGHGDYAAEIGAKQLAFMEDFFDIDYALDKMDLAAMWNFIGGAMENWGLNIYDQDLLLYSSELNHERERRMVAQTLAHELSHQWFGNLVTFEWWTGAWLNEGFATYMQYLGLNYTNPEFESLKTMLNTATQNAMRSDVLPDSHPTLLPDKGNPYDTMVYSGNLVYSKGGALLRMVENFLTMSTFHSALRTYLKRHAFGSVVQDDFFQVLHEHAVKDNRLPSGLTMKEIMDTWTLQKSYPLLKVRSRGNHTFVTITQEEDTPLFMGIHNPKKSLWYVPMAIATKSNPRPGNTFPQYWLKKTEQIQIPHDPSEWIVVNSGAKGYYRVEYDAVLTQQLHDQIERDFTQLNYGTRSQLIDDYFTRAFTGHQQISSALAFTKHLASETEYTVWTPFFFHMTKPYRLFAGSEVYDNMKNYILPKITSVINTLESTRNTSYGIDNLFHAQLTDWACAMGCSSCVRSSLRLFEEWKQNPEQNPIPHIVRPVVYCTAIANRADNFHFALDRFEASQEGKQRKQLIAALGCTQDSDFVSMLLGAAIGSTPQIPKKFVLAALQSVATNHLHRSRLNKFIQDKIVQVVEYFGDATIISKVIRTLSKYHSTGEDLAFLTELVREHGDILDADKKVKEVIEKARNEIEDNILWLGRFRDQFNNWFKAN